jgi:hypothetical protein
MIRRMSDEHKINFLENKEDNIKQIVPQKEKKMSLGELAEEMKSKKLSNKNSEMMTIHHIRSAQSGKITDIGGPDTVSNVDSLNSIWDSEKLEKATKKIDSKTRVQLEKEQIENNKRVAEQKRMDELVENINSTDSRKNSNIYRASDYSGSKYYSPAHGISIFDGKEFERLPEKSAGEKMSDENREKESQEDESWKNSGKAVSSKQLQNIFMGNFFKKQDRE